MLPGPRRVLCVLVAFATAVGLAHAGAAPGAVSASDAVSRAVMDRLGPDVDVSVMSSGVTGTAEVFREARPDPAARMGSPMRFTLISADGAAVPVTVSLRVIGAPVVARRTLARGATIGASDVAAERGVVSGVPLRRLLAIDEVVGTRVLRAIQAGDVVLATSVTGRRAIEPGDGVTVRVGTGAVEVTASMVAADGGRAGDVIRVVNPATRRYLRARVVKKGLVEVINGR
ncbi:MAG: flagellar basal body P-ring formation chaperone FlgA [Vicinamibacterales bacterium]